MSYTAEQVEHVCRTMIPKYDPWVNSDAYYFDHVAALRIINFITECCTFTHAKWAGQPFILQDYQVAIVGNLFGWKKKADGFRRYLRSLWFMAQKCGKTELAAATADYLLHCDAESWPEIVCAAGNAEQAEKIFRAASEMVLNEPEMESRSEVFKRSIKSKVNGGSIKVINSESKTKFGGNISAALIDELHIHQNADLVDVLESSQKNRLQPLTIFTTTAGESTESIAYEIYDYACKVRDGIIVDPEFLPVVYEAPIEADISNPEVWKLACPSLGVNITLETYQRDFKKAQNEPRYLNTFKRLSLNQWVEASTAWLNIEDWKKCGASIVIEQLKGCRAAFGLDLSATVDTTALVAAVEHGDKVVVIPFIFIPRESATELNRRSKRDKAPLQRWIDEKAITATDGNVVDYTVVENKVIELSKFFTLQEVQCDPYNATASANRLIAAGINVQFVKQGWSLNQPTKEIERMIISGEFQHPNNPALTWQVSCTAVKSDEHENHWPIKNRSTGRIDASVAMVMAVNGLKFSGGAAKPSTKFDQPWTGEIVLI